MIIRSAILAAAALGAATLSSPALAGSEVNVRYSDLDLASANGQAQLERRIDAAARRACGVGEVQTGTILAKPKSRECIESTKAAVHKFIAERSTDNSQRGG